MSQLEIGLQGCSVNLKIERFDSFRRDTKVIKRRHSFVPSDVRIHLLVCLATEELKTLQ